MILQVRKSLVKLAGLVLVLASLAYFAQHAYHALARVDLGDFTRLETFVGVAMLTMLYMMCVLPNAFGWHRILVGLGERIPYRRCLGILAFTQMGKYLPGNVGHHVGRVGLARKNGIAVTAGVYSLGYEAVLAALASVHVGALVLLWRPPEAIASHPAFEHRALLMVVLTAGAILAIVLAPLGVRLLSRLRGMDVANGRELRLEPLPALVSYLASSCGLALVGLGLWSMSTFMLQVPPPSPLFFIGAFAASWIVGFLAPGAPAGLGVREAVLSLWLGTAIPPAEAVLVVIALRIATTLGDLLNFLGGAFAMAYSRTRNVANIQSTELPEIDR